jgi:hypothetical protein
MATGNHTNLSSYSSGAQESETNVTGLEPSHQWLQGSLCFLVLSSYQRPSSSSAGPPLPWSRWVSPLQLLHPSSRPRFVSNWPVIRDIEPPDNPGSPPPQGPYLWSRLWSLFFQGKWHIPRMQGFGHRHVWEVTPFQKPLSSPTLNPLVVRCWLCPLYLLASLGYFSWQTAKNLSGSQQWWGVYWSWYMAVLLSLPNFLLLPS